MWWRVVSNGANKISIRRITQIEKQRNRRLTPCWRVPAFIRWIQRERMSRFLLRLSLYEYCKAFSTLSLAILMQFLALPLNPFASFNIAFLFIILSLFLTSLFSCFSFSCFCLRILFCWDLEFEAWTLASIYFLSHFRPCFLLKFSFNHKI